MKPGQNLIDRHSGETPYRVDELVAAGDRYQIAAGCDQERERPVVLRAILYGPDATDAHVAQRRLALKREWEFLKALRDSGLAPSPYDWLEIEGGPIEESAEPVIVCERVEGTNLYDWITEEHPDGLEPTRALGLIKDVVDFLALAHQQKWLWRDFDPRRFIIDKDEAIRAVEIGRIVKRGEALESDQLEINADYVAPEIREEMTGKLQRPAADLYGLGALLSFVLTGEEPRHRVESPLSYDAYEKIQELELPGLELLLARLLQPLAKKRIGRAEKLRPFCDVETLPTRETKGFGMCVLPAPWLGLDIESPEKNQGLRSKLSAGPLVSVNSASQPSPAASASATMEQKRAPNWPLIAALLGIVAAAIGLALFSVGPLG